MGAINKIIVSSETLSKLLQELHSAGYLESRKDEYFKVIVNEGEMWFEQREKFAAGKEILLFKTPHITCEPSRGSLNSREFCFKALSSLRRVLLQISDQPITLTFSEFDYFNVNFTVC